jgi:hypothetical protein
MAQQLATEETTMGRVEKPMHIVHLAFAEEK